MGNLSMRMFSSSPIDEEEKEQAIIDAQIKNEQQQNKGKFAAFLTTVEEIDQKIENDADFAKKVDGDEPIDEEKMTLDFDSDEIDIEFEFEGAIKE